MSEETAIELHEAYVAQETAKQRYREVAKARGVDPSVLGNKQDSKPLSEDALKRSVQQRLRCEAAQLLRRLPSSWTLA